jgi:hypothetical protein
MVILSSLVIHLFVFGMTRLWVKVRFSVLGNRQFTTNLIPIDLITTAPKIPSAQPSPTTATAKPQNQVPNPRTSVAARPNSQPIPIQPGTANPTPSQPGLPQTRISPSSAIPTSQTPSQKPSPITTPVNRPDNSFTPTPTATSPPPSTGGSPQAERPTPTPVPPPPVTPPPATPGGTSGGQGSNNSKPEGAVIASLGELQTNNQKDVIQEDNGDQRATLQSGSQIIPKDYLIALGINPDQTLKIEAQIIVEDTGIATVLPNSSKVLQGNIDAQKAEQLTQKIMEESRFDSTLIAGQKVARDYSVTITISPN